MVVYIGASTCYGSHLGVGEMIVEMDKYLMVVYTSSYAHPVSQSGMGEIPAKVETNI